MSTRVLALIVLVATVSLGAVGMLAQTRPGNTLQLWEYRTEVARERGIGDVRPEGRREGSEGMLNSRGNEGWELVAVTRREIRVDDMFQTETVYTFKRPTRSVNR